eukprot:m.431099 g.431099  ORF g.431099 m.431099 type:complete len:88 (-) comp17257_c0_seq1:62-325(-)
MALEGGYGGEAVVAVGGVTDDGFGLVVDLEVSGEVVLVVGVIRTVVTGEGLLSGVNHPMALEMIVVLPTKAALRAKVNHRKLRIKLR